MYKLHAFILVVWTRYTASRYTYLISLQNCKGEQNNHMRARKKSIMMAMTSRGKYKNNDSKIINNMITLFFYYYIGDLQPIIIN